MTTLNYDQIYANVEQLSSEDQLRLLKDLAVMVQKKHSKKKKRSIMELNGLGKEIWAQVNAEDYINQERNTWNG